MEDKIKKALEKVKPVLQADGGNVEFVSWNEKFGKVEVRLTGMCMGCPMSQITLKQVIETEIKKAVPKVKIVENVS